MKIFNLISFAFIAILQVSCEKKTNDAFQSVCQENLINPKRAIVAKGDNIKVSTEELNKEIKLQIYKKQKEIYDLQFDQLKAVLLEKFINKQTDKTKLSNDKFLEKHILTKKEVSEDEVDNFIAKKNVPKQMVTSQYRQRVIEHLTIELKKNQIAKWLEKQIKQHELKVLLNEPSLPRINIDIGDSAQWGKKNALKVFVVTDFQCPRCKDTAKAIKRVRDEFDGEVKIVFKHFPMPFHSQAFIAAEASLCVYEQNPEVFWNFHDRLFAAQNNLSFNSIKELALEFEINKDTFLNCLQGHKYTDQIRQEVREMQTKGINMIPLVIVKDKVLVSDHSFENISRLIQAEISR
ncbi:MAG: DsbA family protein [Bacteriovoracia bacterium]